MAKAEVSKERNNVLVVAVTIVIVVILLMFFWDRQQQRAVELLRIQARLDFMQEWEPTPLPEQNKQNKQTKTPSKAGRVL